MPELKPLKFSKHGLAKCPVCGHRVCLDTQEYGVVVLSCGHTPRLDAWLLARVDELEERLTEAGK